MATGKILQRPQELKQTTKNPRLLHLRFFAGEEEDYLFLKVNLVFVACYRILNMFNLFG